MKAGGKDEGKDAAQSQIQQSVHSLDLRGQSRWHAVSKVELNDVCIKV